jgi:hypothetical protein
MHRYKVQIKRAGHQILRKLRNRSNTRLRSIGPIKIDECSNPEIEEFRILEDPDLQGYRKKVITPTEPYDFVTNLPPCLKGKECFSGIRPDQKKIIDKVDTPMFDRALHRPTIPHIQCDVFFHWIERYYTYIPILQAKIKTLTDQNESLRQENIDLKVHAERKSKRIKISGNIIIKNVTSVKAIVNYELPNPSLVNF